jgi:Fe-S cluster assembly iron-binding protein IscA
VDTEPASIIDGRDISFSYSPSAALGKTTDEVGTVINTTSIDLTITAKGSCTSTYGYYTSLDEEGNPKDFVYDKSGVTLNYVVATQTIGEGESKIDYKLKLVLPKDYNTNEVSMTPAPVYINGKEVYINADSVTITVSNDLTTQKDSD